jgi:hypothetical protein
MGVHCVPLCTYAYTQNCTVEICVFLTSALFNGDKLVSHSDIPLFLLKKSPVG